jgi:diguanylate cyclase (GGDEF)-like protein
MGRKLRKKRLSVSFKIALTLLLVTLGAGAALTLQEASQAKARVLQGYAQIGPFMANSISSEYQAAVSSTSAPARHSLVDVQRVNGQAVAQNYIRSLIKTVPGLSQVRLYQAHPASTWMSSDGLDYSPPSAAELLTTGVRQFPGNLNGVPVFVTVVPLPKPGPPGVVSVSFAYTLEAEHQAVSRAVRNTLIGLAVVVAIELLILFPLFDALVLRRLRRLGKAAISVTEGDLSVHLPEGDEPPGRDEVSNVARQFDSMVRAMERRTKQQDALTALGQHALEGLPLTDIFHEASVLISEHTGTEYAAILELIEGDLLVMRAGIGWEGKVDSSPAGEAEHNPQAEFTLRNLETVVVEDFASEERFQPSELQAKRGVVSSASLVIPGQGRPFGVLTVESATPHVFSEEEQSFLEFVAGVLAGWIERRQAEEQVTFMAYHDRLTGLANRAMLEEHLSLARARAERGDLSCAILFMDLDNFKSVNDTMGHAAGDELLRQMAGRLREVTRDVDLVARQGGDEFLVLLADIERGSGSEEDARAGSEAVAVEVARRIHEELSQPFRIGDSEHVSSASIGISIYPFDADDVENLLKYADAAMYRSKAAGHGLFCIHGSDVPQR